MDAAEGWQTARLSMEPVTAAHAAEMAPVLDDPGLHEFIGGVPRSAAELAERYERLSTRASADGRQVYGHWVIRVRESGAAVGTVEATLPVDGPAAGPAEVAWVLGRAGQGNGYAAEAAAGLVRRLRADGWPVVAHVHPGHHASQRVAERAGLLRTDVVVDGEQRWASPPA